MRIEFVNTKLKKKMETHKQLRRNYGADNAKKIVQRINELEAAETMDDLPLGARPHPLSGNRKGQFALDVKNPFRLIMQPIGEFNIQDYSTIEAVKILEVVDYH